MPESSSEPSFMGKITLTLVDRVSVSEAADELESLVEGSSSDWLSLEGGTSSSSVLHISPKRSANNSHSPEVLNPARDATKWSQASFSSRATLALSQAEL